MTAQEVMTLLESFGDTQTKTNLLKHGAKEPFFGVKVSDLKKILKKTKKNHKLSLELYATGNSDAMYLAGLMADETKISKDQLNDWIKNAYWYYLSEFAVPWVAAETEFGLELALEWIESEDEGTAAGGWQTLSSIAGLRSDEELNIDLYRNLLLKVEKNIHNQKNRVRHVMNAFVIAIGTYISELTEEAERVANMIGKVHVEMGGTACKVPLATTYIQKVKDKGRVGKKRKTARC